MEAMQRLRIPGFSESNMFDALADTADRMSKIEGRKAILLIASGIDTFSKLTYDKARKSLQESGVPVYSIEMLQVERIMAEGSMGPLQNLDFLQADNELKTFAKETGGQAYFPALHRRSAERVPVDFTISAQPILARLFAKQPGEGWQVPQAHGATCESGDERTVAGDGSKNGQTDQVHDSGKGRIHGTASS